MRAAGVKKGFLNLSGEIGGRPTALAAVGELIQAVHTIDLSANNFVPDDIATIAKAVARSPDTHQSQPREESNR